jgi:hypothetical protein
MRPYDVPINGNSIVAFRQAIAQPLELRTAALLGTICVLVAAAGCRQTPPAPPKTVATVLEPMVQAREAMDRHDYAAAVSFLRDALGRYPNDLEAHYRLGVSASHLDQVDEAGRQFEWVIVHGAPGAPEVQIAREWLAARTTAPAPVSTVVSAETDAPVQKPELASLTGKAVGPDKPIARLQLFLKGLPGSAVKNEYHLLRTDQQGAFHFANLVPGDYMLTNAVAGPVRWRLRVALAASERRVLDLSPANDTTVRDDFPEPRP